MSDLKWCINYFNNCTLLWSASYCTTCTYSDHPAYYIYVRYDYRYAFLHDGPV